MHGLKALSTMNYDDLCDLNGHINAKLMFKPKGLTHENMSSLEPVLFEKLNNNIKLSLSVFWVTTFFQFASTKTALQILLQYVHNFEDILTTVCSKLGDDNDINHKSYDIRQCVLMYSALLKLCTDDLIDCKSQINQLTTQFNHILTTLDQTKDNPKCTKRGMIHSLFNFLFGNVNCSADIESIKNNMVIKRKPRCPQYPNTENIQFFKSNLCRNKH